MKSHQNCEYSIGIFSYRELKTLDELTFTDAYRFKEGVARNLSIAKKIVEFALKREVKDIRLTGSEAECFL